MKQACGLNLFPKLLLFPGGQGGKTNFQDLYSTGKNWQHWVHKNQNNQFMLKFVTYNVTLGHYYFNVGVKNQEAMIYFVS